MAEGAGSWESLLEHADLVLPEDVAASAGKRESFHPGMLGTNGAQAQGSSAW
jgi:hypothetical protein